ncbi:hypothetical protein N7454_002188 [Penicillium verhagenii]|nr:hypothetical protein N7454_002188 [Penicillium verhagenii]
MSPQPTNSSNDSGTTSKTTKLKASCDFCALTKVKCDQTRPQCLRCMKSGVVCHYSETRRIGKARQLYAASRNRSKSPNMQGTWRQQNSNTQQQAMIDLSTMTPHRMSNNRPSHDRGGSSDYTMSMNLFDNFLSQDHEPSNPLFKQTGDRRPATYAMGYDGVGPFPSPESPHSLLKNLDGTEEMEMENMDYIQDFELGDDDTWGSTALGMPAASNHPGDCIMRAHSVLQTLHVSKEACACSNGQTTTPVRTLDAALKDNRMAMDTVHEILECPCANGMNVALLLLMTTHQVMESYRAILVQQSNPSSQRSAPGVDLPLYDIPLTIGGYLLDNEMRTKVILQVIRSEVEKMGTVFNTFAQYAEGVSKQPENAVLATYIQGLKVTSDEVLQSLEK